MRKFKIWGIVFPLLLCIGCGQPEHAPSTVDFGLSNDPILLESAPAASTSHEHREEEKPNTEHSLQETDTDTEHSLQETDAGTEHSLLETDANTEHSLLETDAGTTQEANSMQQTLLSFLKTGLMPMGETMYIWGGGWNEEDTGAGVEATSIGVSSNWKTFADSITPPYDHKKYKYQIHDGLDCSGYVGWCVYNTFATANGQPGYVTKSTDMASFLAEQGFGQIVYDSAADASMQETFDDYRCGDIVSMHGHVWICIGTCSDGSIVIMHSSPPGVRLSGIGGRNRTNEAADLAAKYMKNFFPDWYEKYPGCTSSSEYLSENTVFRWDEKIFADVNTMYAQSTEAVLEEMFH